MLTVLGSDGLHFTTAPAKHSSYRTYGLLLQEVHTLHVLTAHHATPAPHTPPDTSPHPTPHTPPHPTPHATPHLTLTTISDNVSDMSIRASPSQVPH